MSGYIGNVPTPQATQTRQSFTATASQTSFATAGYTAGFLDVYLNGVHLLDSADYTATNGSDIVLTVGAAAGDVLEVVSYSTFEVADVYTMAETYSKVEADSRYVNTTGDTMTGSLTASGQLKQFGSNLVIDDERGTNIAELDTFVMTAGSNYKLARIMTVGDTQRIGTFALMIWMYDSGPHGAGTHYWSASYSGVISTNHSGTAYNATGPSQLTLNSHYHHRTVAEPTFYLDSDNSVGAYGHTNLYINVPVNTQFYNVGVYLKRLAW
jgi:hypothetical protein